MEVEWPSGTKSELFDFDNDYARLPDHFFARVAPTAVSAPRLIIANEGLARQLNIDLQRLSSAEGVQILAGNVVPAKSEPIAMAYAGHQFGNFVPQLGDGRAILLGEVIDRDGVRRDIQLKGAGQTPFSRRGDGRAALGPVLREYVVAEAMSALGIATTRALAVVATGDHVRRETLLPGAVLTRVASSHIRIGTFQYFAARGDVDAVRRLADFAIARHYPEALAAPNRYRDLLARVISRQSELVAKWLLVGFVHGVMNTDNMSIAGETIDFGPCAFLDAYEAGKVFSSIDAMGRYAYANQPRIAHWNLTRLAESLLPLLAEDNDTAVSEAQETLAAFAPTFEKTYIDGLRRKLGLVEAYPDDLALGQNLLERMAANGADFTLTFRRLSDAVDCGDDSDVAILFADPGSLREWSEIWRHRLRLEKNSSSERQVMMRAANPLFIPRNHLVEEAIVAAEAEGDFAPFETLLRVLARPFDMQPGFERYAEPPRSEQVVHQTFCGT